MHARTATVIPFPQRPYACAFGPDDRAALDRLVDRLRGRGATGWEIEQRPGHARAYVLGAEDETLLIVAKGAQGVVVSAGHGPDPLWQGDRLAGYEAAAARP